MKVAIVGSRSVDEKFYQKLCENVPKGASVIISGGAKGADSLAKKYAEENELEYIEFLPEYDKYGRSATLKRNKQIVDMADYVLVMWDFKSRGSKFVMNYCSKTNTYYNIIKCIEE